MAYPVHFQIEYHEQASRLTTFFRAILLIPHLIVLVFWAILAYLIAIVAWFAILFTGRYPKGLFDLNASFLGYLGRVSSYMYLLTDQFPPFSGGTSGDYPIRIDVDYQERLSRLTTFFRLLLAIPAGIIQYALNIVAQVMAFVAWFVILFLGRLPEGMYEVMVLPQRYNVRYSAYGLLLLTDEYPWFQEETDPDVPAPSWNEPLPPPAG